MIQTKAPNREEEDQRSPFLHRQPKADHSGTMVITPDDLWRVVSNTRGHCQSVLGSWLRLHLGSTIGKLSGWPDAAVYFNSVVRSTNSNVRVP